MKKCRALQYSPPLGFFVHGQQDLQIVGVTEIGMVAVCAFYDVQLFGRNRKDHLRMNLLYSKAMPRKLQAPPGDMRM